jgi:hypothetical protein
VKKPFLNYGFIGVAAMIAGAALTTRIWQNQTPTETIGLVLMFFGVRACSDAIQEILKR